MKKYHAGRIAALISAAVLFILVLSASAAADHPLRLTQDLEPVCEVTRGENAVFSVEAVGGRHITYQWYNNAGAFGWEYPSVSFPAYADDEIYCVVSSGEESVESTHCAVTVREPSVPLPVPRITVQPVSVNLSYGQSAILSVQADCMGQGAGVELAYQWYSSPLLDGRYAAPIKGATSSTYVIPPSYTPSKLYYICMIHSTNGVDVSQDVCSDVATVYCGDLNITKHPTGETVKPGGKATFIARAEGAVALQWRIVRNDGSFSFFRADEAPSYINGLKVYGVDTDTLVLDNIPASMNGMSVLCVFYADAARTQFKVSNSALITVTAPSPTPAVTSYIPKATPTPSVGKTLLAPSISVRPELVASEDGQIVSLAVNAVDNNASGTYLRYQWYRNSKNSRSGGTAVSGARSASYVPEDPSDGKYYYVGVWATDGSTTSKAAYTEPVLLDASRTDRGVLLAPSISVRPEITVSENGRNAHLSILAVDNNDDTAELDFQWYRNTRNSNIGGTAVSSAHYESYNPIILNGDRYYYVGVWATDGERTSKVVYSEPVLVSKSALRSAVLLAPSISVRPELISSKDGKSASLSVAAVDNNDGTELQYQWYRNSRSSNSGGTAIAGADSASFAPPASSGSKYYYVGVWATDGDSTSKVAYSEAILVN